MPIEPRVPEELTHGPFTVADALRAGLSRRQLQGKSWRRLGTGLYVWAGTAEDPLCVLQVLSRRLPPRAAFSCRTAGWLHGMDLEPCHPVDVTVPLGRSITTRSGVSIRRGVLPSAEVVQCRHVQATSPMRTTFDLARFLPIGEALVAVDMALHIELVQLEQLSDYVAAHHQTRGVAKARRVVALAEPRAESPMETRLRLLLVLAGLPRPVAQVGLSDDHGLFVGRVDLYYRDQRLAIEYDGSTHRDSVAADNRRQNRLLSAGYRLLRFTSVDVYHRPETVVAQVRAALRP